MARKPDILQYAISDAENVLDLVFALAGGGQSSSRRPLYAFMLAEYHWLCILGGICRRYRVLLYNCCIGCLRNGRNRLLNDRQGRSLWPMRPTDYLPCPDRMPKFNLGAHNELRPVCHACATMWTQRVSEFTHQWCVWCSQWLPRGSRQGHWFSLCPYVAISASDRIAGAPSAAALLAATAPCLAANTPLLLRVAAENEEINLPKICDAVSATAFVTLARARLSSDREIPDDW